MSARWIRAHGINADEPVFSTEDGLVLAGRAGPTVILSFGDWRLYLEGRETLENLIEATTAAFDEDARSRVGG